MADRWLKNIVDGEIYRWNEILAENPRTKEVTEEEAFPEKFIPKAQKGRKPELDLSTEEDPIPVKDTVAPEIAAEATRNIAKKSPKKK